MNETAESTELRKPIDNLADLNGVYRKLMDKILYYFAGENFNDEVQLAKLDFFDNSGVLDESSSQYELRMSQFFDWYFFTRELKGYAQTPLIAASLTRELRFSEEEEKILVQFKNHRHSLFEFLKIKGPDLYLRDLIKGDKIAIENSLFTDGFTEKEFFEARLLPYELKGKKGYFFSRGFCFHPSEANKFILSEIKKLKKNPDLNPKDFIFRLMKMRYKYERYRHVKVDVIYSNNNKVGL